MRSVHEHAAADGMARRHQATHRQHEGGVGGDGVEHGELRIHRIHAPQRLLHQLNQRVLLLARRQREAYLCVERTAVSVRELRGTRNRAELEERPCAEGSRAEEGCESVNTRG